ncbi:RNA polymerase sigma factor [Rhodospirillum centenum]|uniref:RNA polymerase sigma factor n=1 Tax=Rhodospirillum centenum TaxID=34018 RepID=UPI000673F418|nr:RNA polymerase sigma factor [Rhodospirillum centenum]
MSRHKGEGSAHRRQESPGDTVEAAEHRALLRRFFQRRLRAPDDIEDHIQEVYCRVLATAAQQKKIQSWRGILLRTASTVWIDQFRRDRARLRDHHVDLLSENDAHADPSASPEDVAAARRTLRDVEAALMELEPICRQAFMLARYEGFSHRDIAERLGIPTVSVGRHVERALAHLARRLAECDGDPR